MIYSPYREGTSVASSRSATYVHVIVEGFTGLKNAIHRRPDRECFDTQIAFLSEARLPILPFEYFIPFNEQAVRNEQKLQR
jgi:hypothetical protein